MPTHLTATRLRAELFRTLDQVIATGDPVEVQRPGGAVRIVPDLAGRKLSALTPHPGTINGNPDDLASLSWEESWKPML